MPADHGEANQDGACRTAQGTHRHRPMRSTSSTARRPGHHANRGRGFGRLLGRGHRRARRRGFVLRREQFFVGGEGRGDDLNRPGRRTSWRIVGVAFAARSIQQRRHGRDHPVWIQRCGSRIAHELGPAVSLPWPSGQVTAFELLDHESGNAAPPGDLLEVSTGRDPGLANLVESAVGVNRREVLVHRRVYCDWLAKRSG